MKQQPVPYRCQIYVCVNDRQGARKSCADGGSTQIRLLLKERLQLEGVRVSQSLCMGLCGEGPNVVIYPQNRWYSGVTEADVEQVVSEVKSLLGES